MDTFILKVTNEFNYTNITNRTGNIVFVSGEYDYLSKLHGVIDIENDHEIFDNLVNINTTDFDIESNCIEPVSNGPLVALIDSGLDIYHSKLRCNIWNNIGYNFIDNNIDLTDYTEHGTHCAGIVLSNSVPDTKLMPLKVFDKYGKATLSNVIKAVVFATNNGADIISMSFSSNVNSKILNDIIKDNINVLFVTAAGNNGRNNDELPNYPSNIDSPNLISVAALNGTTLASFSNYGKKSVDIAAPGVSIISTVPGNKLKQKSGTSMAVPYISGIITHYLMKDIPVNNILCIIKSNTINNNLPIYTGGWFDFSKLNDTDCLLASNTFSHSLVFTLLISIYFILV